MKKIMLILVPMCTKHVAREEPASLTHRNSIRKAD